jgi:predicted transposase YdaD
VSKPWDNNSKRLLVECSQDFMDWLKRGAQSTGSRSEALESISVEADIMHEAIMHGKRVMFHVEFQSGPHPNMARRLLEYSVLAYRRYNCPVYSFVIYLKKCSPIPQSPLVLTLPDGKEMLRFHYEVIELCDIPYEDLMATELPGLLPLVPLAQGGAKRDVLEEIISRLIQLAVHPESELLFLVYGFASLAFERDDDLDWLDRRFAMLRDILSDSPAVQHLRKVFREEALKEGREEGREEGRLETLRNILSGFVQARFPTLMPLVKEKVVQIQKPETLESLTLKVGLSQTLEEALSYLLNVDNL